MKNADYNFSQKFTGYGLLHTPEGVRDIYNGECAKKNKVQKDISQVLYLHGFKEIQTPTFEFFDIFNQERGTIASKEMYKFFDKEGSTLVLRPDFTPSIARCVAKYYKEESMPIRLSYVGNTFINNSSYQGKLKETTQVGAELINDDTSDADAQMIVLTIECLLKAGLTDFQVEIGHADFFNGLIEEANLDMEESMQLKDLMETKNIFGVEELIEGKELKEELKQFMIQLPELFGNTENLALAEKVVKNERSLSAIDRLKKLEAIIKMYGYDQYISFDLGMLSKYNYYNGIIFRGYTYGTGDVVVTGGRYDNLVGQFGKQAPAIGFAIVIDQLMMALLRQKVDIPMEQGNILIVYPHESTKQAIELGNKFRSTGHPVELLRSSSKQTLEDYMEYGKRNDNISLYMMEDKDTIRLITLSDTNAKLTTLEDLIKEI